MLQKTCRKTEGGWKRDALNSIILKESDKAVVGQKYWLECRNRNVFIWLCIYFNDINIVIIIYIILYIYKYVYASIYKMNAGRKSGEKLLELKN